VRSDASVASDPVPVQAQLRTCRNVFFAEDDYYYVAKMQPDHLIKPTSQRKW